MLHKEIVKHRKDINELLELLEVNEGQHSEQLYTLAKNVEDKIIELIDIIENLEFEIEIMNDNL